MQQKMCQECSLIYNSSFAVWDKKLLCQNCFDMATDKAFNELIVSDISLESIHVQTRIHTKTRQELCRNGWSSVIVCHVLEAAQYDAISSYDENMRKISYLIKTGCTCLVCKKASFSFEDFINERVTPSLFLSHVLKWDQDKIQHFYKSFT